MPRYGHALYDFEGDESQSELTFFAGDEVTITNEVYNFYRIFLVSFLSPFLCSMVIARPP